ncbi:hypothetical protein GPAL_2052 [Glaciecola pallidula DSM 14239 = ACAM 615]|uniref:Uncharacterized protein n=1 Tax=Brumicola pallidula DSM 14239 = ACAM 615 TaxID=1121922 RepID=K6ZJ55_9ALTE|nr:hypothetical protein GPAL_2052 [Glaciecola pallidula DSM 14239 = ACAM 615]
MIRLKTAVNRVLVNKDRYIKFLVVLHAGSNSLGKSHRTQVSLC